MYARKRIIKVSECSRCGCDIDHTILNDKLTKLKQLLMFTDPILWDTAVGEIQLKQYKEFIRCFPEEGTKGIPMGRIEEK